MLFFAVHHECHHGGPHWMPLISSAFVQHKDHHQIPMPEADRRRVWEAGPGSGRDSQGIAERTPGAGEGEASEPATTKSSRVEWQWSREPERIGQRKRFGSSGSRRDLEADVFTTGRD